MNRHRRTDNPAPPRRAPTEQDRKGPLPQTDLNDRQPVMRPGSKKRHGPE